MRLNLSENRNLGRWRMEATFPGELELLFSWPCGWKEEVKAKEVMKSSRFSLTTPKGVHPWGKDQLETHPPHSFIFIWGLQGKMASC